MHHEAHLLVTNIGDARTLQNGITVLESSYKYWHGELVILDTLNSLVFADTNPELIHAVYGFSEVVGCSHHLLYNGFQGVNETDLLKDAKQPVHRVNPFTTKLENSHRKPRSTYSKAGMH